MAAVTLSQLFLPPAPVANNDKGFVVNEYGATSVPGSACQRHQPWTSVVDYGCKYATNGVSDATFARADRRFGKTGVVDLVGITSYYTLRAMQLNTARYRMPKDGIPLPRLPE